MLRKLTTDMFLEHFLIMEKSAIVLVMSVRLSVRLSVCDFTLPSIHDTRQRENALSVTHCSEY
jgi:hypothetical protein